MKKYILTSSTSFPSARLLRDSLQRLTGDKFMLTSKINKNEPPVIRYGNSHGDWKNDTAINPKEFIQLMSNKRGLSQLLKECEIKSPYFFRGNIPESFPVLVRESLWLSGGKGITVCRNIDEFNSAWKSNFWWTPFIKMEFECRLHILGTEIARLFRKTWEQEHNEPEFPIRNNNEYAFRLRNIERYVKLKDLFNNLYKMLSQTVSFDLSKTFCAFDVGWDSINKQYVIIEGNTAPGLNDNTADIYAQFLMENINL